MRRQLVTAIFFTLMGVSTAYAGCLDKLNDSSSVTEQITCLKEEVSNRASVNSSTSELPIGTIVAWANAGSLPEGWAICNGDNGTPDLRGKFLQGVGTYSESGVDPEGTQSHNHPATSQAVGKPGAAHTVAGTDKGDDSQWWTLYSHTHGMVGSGSNIPPNFKVVFIMKSK